MFGKILANSDILPQTMNNMNRWDSSLGLVFPHVYTGKDLLLESLLSHRPHRRCLDDDVELRRGVKKVMKVIVGLLKDRVEVADSPDVKGARTEKYNRSCHPRLNYIRIFYAQ